MSDKPKPIKVRLTPAEIEAAEQYQCKVLAKIQHTPNYTGLYAPDRFKVGYMCEIALSRVLTDRNIQFEWLTNDDGHPDDGDFRLWPQSNPSKPFILDIKGSTHPRAQYLMVSEDQWKKYPGKVNVLVGSIISGDEVSIHGWMLNWEFEAAAERYFHSTPLLRVLLSELHDMELMLPKLALVPRETRATA